VLCDVTTDVVRPYVKALVRTDVSEEPGASFIRVTKIGFHGGDYKELCLLACYALWLVFLHSVRRLLVTANVVPSSPILVTLMMDAPKPCYNIVYQYNTYFCIY
jgi:hypothetical protein